MNGIFDVHPIIKVKAQNRTMKKIVSACLLMLAITGCSSDDPKTTLDGNWNLVSVEGGLTGINDNFADGEVNWKFDTNAETFEVSGEVGDDREQLLPAGLYDYMLTDNEEGSECNRNIVVDVVDFGCYQLQGQRLKIGSTDGDGYLITLER